MDEGPRDQQPFVVTCMVCGSVVKFIERCWPLLQ